MARIPVFVLLTAMAATANADVVIFENTNPSLDWLRMSGDYFGEFEYGQNLDITSDAFSQPAFGVPAPSGTIGFFYVPGGSSADGNFLSIVQTNGATLARSSTPSVYVDGYDQLPYNVFGPELFQNGDQIGPAATWTGGLPVWMSNSEGIFTTVTEQFTVGVRLSTTDGFLYGFVEFEYVATSPLARPQYRPLRWGYESTPDTPFVVPAPGSLALLVGSGLWCSRRRR